MSVILNQLKDCLSQIDANKTIYVAFSGGIDSTVLLHAATVICRQTNHRLKAIHVNHQLHADSLLWSQHCEEICQDWNVFLQNFNVNVLQFNQHGLEGAAREARYQAFEDFLTDKDVLLTAHHSDDQMETIMLQMLRGAGVHGLAACARERSVGKARLMRPLLTISRAQIENYAQQQQLQWLEDPSNQSLEHDRNYLRHKVMPLLHARWHNLSDIASRVSQWQSEAAILLDQIADNDLQNSIDELGRLQIDKMDNLDYLREKNLLRRWIRSHGCHVPNSDILARIIYEVMYSREDAQACVRWQNHEIRKFRNRLYLLANWPDHDAQTTFEWDLQKPLEIQHLDIVLTAQALSNYGVNLDQINRLSVCFRQGGEVMRPNGRGCQKDLKSLFQEAGVEPWLRDRLPLLYNKNELIFVWGYWIQEGYAL